MIEGTDIEVVHGIVPQQQPTPASCVQTCLAMALGVPVSEVLALYGDKAMNQQRLTAALTECAVYWNQMIHATLIFEGWHFVTVPSLNNRGGNHCILLFSDGGRLTVLDPSTKETYQRDGSDLRGWSNLTPFYLGGRLPLPRDP